MIQIHLKKKSFFFEKKTIVSTRFRYPEELILPEYWKPVWNGRFCKACSAPCPDAALFVEL